MINRREASAHPDWIALRRPDRAPHKRYQQAGSRATSRAIQEEVTRCRLLIEADKRAKYDRAEGRLLRCGRAWSLHYLDGMTWREVGAALGVCESRARQLAAIGTPSGQG